MARATAVTVTKRTVAVASLYSTDDTDSNMHDRFSRTLSVDRLKGKFTPKLKMKHQSPVFKVEDYYNNDFFCVVTK